jgi:nicotinate-nucleotide adenylyltransferase
MAQLGVEGEVLFDVSACEMERTGPSYTLDTVRQFRSTYGPQASLYWLIGGDSLAELATWHEPRQLVDECTIVTAVRRGHDLGDLRQLEKTLTSEQIARLKEYALDTPRIDVSATEIRRRVRAGRSIRYLVPRAVERYILAQGLYLKSE